MHAIANYDDVEISISIDGTSPPSDDFEIETSIEEPKMSPEMNAYYANYYASKYSDCRYLSSRTLKKATDKYNAIDFAKSKINRNQQTDLF